MTSCRDAALDALGVSFDADPEHLAPLAAPDAAGLTIEQLHAQVLGLVATWEAAYRRWARMPDTDDAATLGEVALCEQAMDDADAALLRLGLSGAEEAGEWLANACEWVEEQARRAAWMELW